MHNTSISNPSLGNIWRFSYEKSHAAQIQDKKFGLENRIPAQAVLQNFMLERLLERITVSKYRDKIILKGGMLIASMIGIGSRTTMDMDATLRGYPLSEETIWDVGQGSRGYPPTTGVISGRRSRRITIHLSTASWTRAAGRVQPCR